MSQAELPADILEASVRDFVQATAARTPTPGGGSVAALSGALAAALGQMALQFTIGKKQFEPHRAELEAALEKLRRAAGLMEELVAEDIAAYQALAVVLKLPAEARAADPRYLPAVVAGVRAPESTGLVALNILETCAALRDRCNRFLLSDLGAAGALACATVHVAELNVLANHRLLPTEAEATEVRQRAAALSRKADAIWADLQGHLRTVL